MDRRPYVGAQVLYRMLRGRSAGAQRPAVITIVHASGRVGLRVHDAGIHDAGSEVDTGGMGFSGFIDGVLPGPEPGMWQWPE